MASALWLAAACASTGHPPADKAPVQVASAPSVESVEPAPSSLPPVADQVPEPAPRATWTLLEHARGACAECLPRVVDRCNTARTACDAECSAYLECVRPCPPPETRDADGGYPQADCVIACRERFAKGAELGDAYLWCACCDSPCKADCRPECARYKSGIAGPIGAGCD